MRIQSALVDAVRNRQAVLFAGAGISRNSIGFGATYLRDQIGLQIQRDYPAYDFRERSLEDVCDEYAALNDTIMLLHNRSSLIPQDLQPHPSHIAADDAF